MTRPGKPQELAIDGGQPMITKAWPLRNTYGKEEEEAALRVIRSGCLSRFQGSWGADFLGGPEVRAFEEKCAAYFSKKHAITVNSWTSGLTAMMGAIHLEPGDEVITSPWTMCASATSILHWNAIPVFADIDPSTFCIDPRSVQERITEKTRAILAIDIFGQSADMVALRAIADAHDLYLLSDCAQAPGAVHHNQFAGTYADIGGYSLNYHKHIHTGEGGILVTDDDDLALRMQMIRNHAEAIVEDANYRDISNMVGFNFRMGEIEAAFGSCQLEKLSGQVARRQEIAQILNDGLAQLPGLVPPLVADGNTHVYYIYGMKLELNELSRDRAWIYEALAGEGVPGIAQTYVNVHLLPMFQQKIAYGKAGYPWTHPGRESSVDYRKGICPVAEYLNDASYLGLETCVHEMSDEDLDLIVAAFHKVWRYCV